MQQVLDQLQHLGSLSFEDARDTAAWAGIAVTPVVAAIRGIDYFRHPDTTETGLGGVDPVLLEKVRNEVGSHGQAHRRRWLLPTLGATTISLFAMNGLIPITSEDVTDAGSATVLVIDQSNPMRYTLDMGTNVTRSDAVNSALVNATNNISGEVRIGAVTFGSNNEVAAPLSTDRGVLTAGINKGDIDPNGVDLAGGLKTASDIFAGNDDITGENLILLTDGIVDEAPAVRNYLEAAVKNGEKVTVIVTGTTKGEYKRTPFDTEATASGATTSPFTGIDGVTVKQVTDADTLTKELHDTIKTATTRTVKKPFKGFTWLAEGIGGLGVVGLISKALKRKIK